jgi:hypothetical protein
MLVTITLPFPIDKMLRDGDELSGTQRRSVTTRTFALTWFELQSEGEQESRKL